MPGTKPEPQSLIRTRTLVLFSLVLPGLLVLLNACISSRPEPKHKEPIPNSPGKVNEKSRNADPELLKQYVLMLLDTPRPRNWKHTDMLDKSAGRIHKVLSRHLDCRYQDYSAKGNTYRNVVCTGGKTTSGDVWVVGAHYDVYGDFPGADDNASGVAGLLEFARIVEPLLPELPFRLELVAYTLEEPPFFRTPDMGSRVHARSLANAGDRVLGMLCLDMIGYFTEKPVQKVPHEALRMVVPRHGNFIAAIANPPSASLAARYARAVEQSGQLEALHLVVPESVRGADFSDHGSYWHEGFPAILITDSAFYRNPHYHTEMDTPDTLDYKKMAHTVDGLRAFFESILSSRSP